MGCKKCDSKYVVNKWFNLCSKCNNIRLHGNEYGKTTQHKENKIKSLKTSKNDSTKRVVGKGGIKNKLTHNVKVGEKRKTTLQLDEELYERVFNSCKIHECEECGTKLNDNFRNDKGFIESRFRYSHIIPKSIASELRHEDENINNLCLPCHQKWDFGNKKEMRIYVDNQLKYPRYLESND